MHRKRKGYLIAFEGLDGAGLTTHAFLLQNWLLENGVDAIVTKEPTKGLIGGLIKSALMKEWNPSLRTLQLLFVADRSHHLEKVILPSLEKGKIVICDRYIFSTLAYGSLSLDYNWLKQLNSKFPLPDLTFILEISPETSLRRIERARYGEELFEEIMMLKKVLKNYRKIAREYKNVFVIDAERPIKEVSGEIKRIVKAKLRGLQLKL